MEEFRGAVDNRPDGMSNAVAAIKVLLEMIKRSEGRVLTRPYAIQFTVFSMFITIHLCSAQSVIVNGLLC